jgi:hypothetical protein
MATRSFETGRQAGDRYVRYRLELAQLPERHLNRCPPGEGKSQTSVQVNSGRRLRRHALVALDAFRRTLRALEHRLAILSVDRRFGVAVRAHVFLDNAALGPLGPFAMLLAHGLDFVVTLLARHHVTILLAGHSVGTSTLASSEQQDGSAAKSCN